MEHFSYSLLLSLLHSFWQAAVLLCIYTIIALLIKKGNPVHKRNVLFFLIIAQQLTTVSTFYIYYTGSPFFYSAEIISGLSELLIRQPYIEIAAPWLIFAYSIALIYKSARLIFNWNRFRVSVKASWIKPSVNFKLFTSIKANEFGIHRKVILWYSNTIHTPLTFGFFKPVILLPVALVNNLSVKEAETLIIHELTHIKNNDYFFNWILVVCETIFFFNPFIQVIAGKIKLEREKNCDAQVLQFNYAPLDYAETLLKTAKFKTSPTPFFLAAVFKNAQLIKRIQFFTEEKNLRFNKKNYSRLSILPLLFMIVLNIFLINFLKNKNISNEFSYDTSPAITGINNENIQDHFSTAGILPLTSIGYELNENDATLSEDAPLEKISEKLSEKLEKLSAEKEVLRLKQIETMPAEIEMPVPVPVSVALVENDDNSKEIVLTEENSATGKAVTKVYKMSFENGEWKTRLMWTITERRSATDSLRYIKDSVNNVLHNQSQ